mmetsp:Transcript_11204/g.29865  ORF Transcript_11204/g.29865 Transcript_11204/m.29865 type:complete len:165 (+) Transcript_11204:61-555(+)
MPNAFGCLSDLGYGPQYTHNVAFISPASHLSKIAECCLLASKGKRKIGGAAACVEGLVTLSADVFLSEPELDARIFAVELHELEDLDPEDFDTVVVLGFQAPSAAEALTADWAAHSNIFKWALAEAEGGARDAVFPEVEKKIASLLDHFEQLAMKRACGQGVSC